MEHPVSHFLQDLRYAARMLVRAPGFTLMAVLTLAIGIGANTTIFSVVNALLLRPLPYPGADRLVMVWQDMRARGGPATEWATPGNYVDWKARTDVFTSLTVVRGWNASLPGDDGAEALVGEQVTHDYFDVLQVPPAEGRGFRAEEDVPNAPRVAIISHALWARRFGSDPRAIGRTVTISGEPHEIIGVMPKGFRPAILATAELWRPLRLNTATPARGAVVLRAVGRLQPGVSVKQASEILAALARQLETLYPESNSRVGINPVSMQEQLVGPLRPALLALMGAVGFVLLIACANIANLLLTRASGRGREIAVRMALGAGRRHIVRQLLTESLLLALVGGGAGVLAGTWGLWAFTSMAPAGVPGVAAIEFDTRVLVFATALTIVTGIVFGVAPAWQASRGALAFALQQGGRGEATAAGRNTRRALIVVEVALALMLLVAAGLLARTFVELQHTDLGFDPSHVIAGYVQPPPVYENRAQLTALYDRLLDGVSSLPGVTEAAISSVIPLGGDSDTSFEIEGRAPPAAGENPPVAWYRLVSAGYFDLMGIPLRRGRIFAPREAQPVVVINELMAGKYWPGEEPLGRRIRVSPDAPWLTVVGVVPGVQVRGAREGLEVEMYVPYWQMPERGVSLLARTGGEPGRLAAPLRQMVASIDRGLPVSSLEPMDATVAGSLEGPRFLAVLTGLFAVVAMALAGVGIYGVISYGVAQRTREIGVRIALGAARPQILTLVVGDGLKLAVAGLAAGAAGGLVAGRMLQRLLYRVHGSDPVTFAATAAVLLLVALLASYVPARRAMRVDPVEALRAS